MDTELLSVPGRMVVMDELKSLPDTLLLHKLERSARFEAVRLQLFLAWLGEADRRKLAEVLGYSSTFDFCVRRLRLSEDESYRRIHAARAAVIRPELLSALADGQLTLTAISRIAPFVRRPDAPEIIARAAGRSARELEELLAPLRPEMAKRDVVRVVAVVPPAGKVPALRVDFNFRGSPALRDAVERVRDLLTHKYPYGSLDQIFLEVALDYLKRHDPLRTEAAREPRAKPATTITTAVRRRIWRRDGGRCSYVGVDGVRCLSRRFLEIDHATPRALGGGDEPANLRLLCRAHNDVERREKLGEGGATISIPSAEPPGSPLPLGRRPAPSPETPHCASP